MELCAPNVLTTFIIQNFNTKYFNWEALIKWPMKFSDALNGPFGLWNLKTTTNGLIKFVFSCSFRFKQQNAKKVISKQLFLFK